MHAYHQLEEDGETKVIIITGADGSFATSPAPHHCLEAVRASNAPLKSLAPTPKEMQSSNRLKQLAALATISKPTIAAVSGDAIGEGCELALTCDLIVAAKTARFSLPEVCAGVIPGTGGTQRLPRAIGMRRAMEMILTGKEFTAVQAFEWGLINALEPRRRVLDKAIALGREMAKNPLCALIAAKKAVRFACSKSFEQGMRVEKELYCERFGSEDILERFYADTSTCKETV